MILVGEVVLGGPRWFDVDDMVLGGHIIYGFSKKNLEFFIPLNRIKKLSMGWD